MTTIHMHRPIPSSACGFLFWQGKGQVFLQNFSKKSAKYPKISNRLANLILITSSTNHNLGRPGVPRLKEEKK